MARNGLWPAAGIAFNARRERFKAWIVEFQQRVEGEAALADRSTPVHGDRVCDVGAYAKLSCGNNLQQKTADFRVLDPLLPQP